MQPEKCAENKCLTPIVHSTRGAGSRQKGSDTFFSLDTKDGLQLNHFLDNVDSKQSWKVPCGK
jgi:hypothetical protein